MSLSIHGISVGASAVLIGRAVRLQAGRVAVPRYYIDANQVPAHMQRLRDAKEALWQEMRAIQTELSQSDTQQETHQELAAILEVHMMLLRDEAFSAGVGRYIEQRHYNVEWALETQLDVLSAQFEAMQDAYLRERKSDLQQLVNKLLIYLEAHPSVRELSEGARLPSPVNLAAAMLEAAQGDAMTAVEREESVQEALILVAHDLSPADMMGLKGGVFQGFVLDVGTSMSHAAIVARSLGIPAIVGAKSASQLVRQDDSLVFDADAAVLIVDPSEQMLQQYRRKQMQAQQGAQDRLASGDLVFGDASKSDFSSPFAAEGPAITLLANIELPSDAHLALAAGAQGIGLFRTEFLFMGRDQLPSEQEQYEAYSEVVRIMQGLPVTIRTLDVGADKPLNHQADDTAALAGNASPMGLRGIRWCLAAPNIFLTQLRALLRAAADGPLDVLIPMLTSEQEIQQTFLLFEQAKAQLQAAGVSFGKVRVGAMIEVPAAALSLPTFIRHFEFLSIGSNDLIQYTLAVDRSDESVAHLYDAAHPAVWSLLRLILDQCQQSNKPVSLCGEMAADPKWTNALLAVGLRSFSMPPFQLKLFREKISHSKSATIEALL